MMNKKINIFKYYELFRLCQNKYERETAQKCSAKEWLNRWCIYITKSKTIADNNNELNTNIDLGSYNSSATSGNISWESVN